MSNVLGHDDKQGASYGSVYESEGDLLLRDEDEQSSAESGFHPVLPASVGVVRQRSAVTTAVKRRFTR